MIDDCGTLGSRASAEVFGQHLIAASGEFEKVEKAGELGGNAEELQSVSDGSCIDDDLIEVRPLSFHGGQSCGFKHLHRLDMDVAVGNHARAAASTARLAYTRMISRRYSGVSRDVVSGFANRAASSPTAAAEISLTGFPINA